MTLSQARSRLRQEADPNKAAFLQGFFKTGPGEYAEGDRFLGVVVPKTRRIARAFRDLPLASLRKLLASKIHEERLLALLILVGQFERGDDRVRKQIYDLYLKNLRRINNWDLVDGSAPQIVGGWLVEKKKGLLTRMAKSRNLWERRVAMMATLAFIREGKYGETMRLARILLRDPEDLIHKAVGWMLREVGNRDRKTEEEFLRKHYRKMPRTMLRYAIEKFPESRRKAYLKGTI